MPNTLLSFDELSAGDIVAGQYTTSGVTISSTGGPAMIFDTDNPTGGDSDLATDNMGNVLIISEDGDSSDPDDDAAGGTFTFQFTEPTKVLNFRVLDTEERGYVRLYDEDGNLMKTLTMPSTSDGGQATMNVYEEGVYRMEVQLCGSGAIDAICFEEIDGLTGGGEPELDGIVSGTEGDDIIDIAYDGDPHGDMIDNDDAVLPGEGPNDDIVEAGSGDDTVMAGEGDDTVYGDDGDDTVYGGAGNDEIYGDSNGETQPIVETEFTLDWSEEGTDGNFTLENDGVELGVTVASGDGWHIGNIAGQQVMRSTNQDDDNPTTLTFDQPVSDVSFELYDIDESESSLTWDDQMTVIAYDADGNIIPVVISNTDHHSVTVNPDGSVTIDSEGNDAPGVEGPGAADSVTVSIAGPVASITIIHQVGNDGSDSTGTVGISDLTATLVTGGEATGNDELHGGLGDDDIYGEAGDDLLFGEGGDDNISGGDGNDTAYGGQGNDVIDTSGGDPLPDLGFPGLYPADSDPNNDKDTVYGGSGNDTITTGDDADYIDGGSGADYIDGGIDADTIKGGAGSDTIIGGEGSDDIDGGTGNDTIYGGLDPSFPDSLNLTDDVDPVPNNGMDVIRGGDGNDTIYGQDDDDTLYGDAGNDYIDGGIDEDEIHGGTGDDTIIGGQGADLLSGGDDQDTFIVDSEEAGAGDVIDGGAGGVDNDTLDLTGSGPLNIIYTPGDPESGTVEFLDGVGGAVTSTLTFTEIENVIPCFTPGTLIATPKGERLVEELREGDKIITRDNGIQEIRWKGAKELSHKDLAKAPHLKPILIKAGSLGNNLPERDMLVSPNHRMLVANDKTSLYFEEREVLAAAKHLVNNQGIREVDTLGTTYIHFMFDNHEVVLSNGAWTESFQPGDYTLKGIGNAQRTEIFELFPELQTEEGIEAYQSARKTLKKHEAQLLVR